ncbi:hypothetical protein [Bradyrhizobium sp. JR3.5]
MTVEIGRIGAQIETADRGTGGADCRALAGKTDGLLAAIDGCGEIERRRAGEVHQGNRREVGERASSEAELSARETLRIDRPCPLQGHRADRDVDGFGIPSGEGRSSCVAGLTAHLHDPARRLAVDRTVEPGIDGARSLEVAGGRGELQVRNRAPHRGGVIHRGRERHAGTSEPSGQADVDSCRAREARIGRGKIRQADMRRQITRLAGYRSLGANRDTGTVDRNVADCVGIVAAIRADICRKRDARSREPVQRREPGRDLLAGAGQFRVEAAVRAVGVEIESDRHRALELEPGEIAEAAEVRHGSVRAAVEPIGADVTGIGGLDRGRADLQPLDGGVAAQIGAAVKHQRSAVADGGCETRIARRDTQGPQIHIQHDMRSEVAGLGARDRRERGIERVEISVRQAGPRHCELGRERRSLDRSIDPAVESQAADRTLICFRDGAIAW